MFNQLTVDDPRFPHGVTEVKGTRDPLKARLVIHGWFVEPRPYVVGGLSTAQVQSINSSLRENRWPLSRTYRRSMGQCLSDYILAVMATWKTVDSSPIRYCRYLVQPMKRSGWISIFKKYWLNLNLFVLVPNHTSQCRYYLSKEIYDAHTTILYYCSR